jgi:carboxypeptidase D
MVIKKKISICVFIVLNCFLIELTSAFKLIQSEDETFLQNPHYHNTDEMKDLFAKLQKEYPNIVKAHSIGKSLENRDLVVIEIRKNVQQPRQLLTPMFKYVANMHGDEMVDNQQMVYLAQYLLKNYGKVNEVTEIVDQTDIFLMPSQNPDGFKKSVVSKNLRKFKF